MLRIHSLCHRSVIHAVLVCAGAAVLRMSSDGRCCSIVWPEARRYAIYAQGSADEWRRVDEESGTSVAWAGASSTYAVLHQPKVLDFCGLVILQLTCDVMHIASVSCHLQ